MLTKVALFCFVVTEIFSKMEYPQRSPLWRQASNAKIALLLFR